MPKALAKQRFSKLRLPQGKSHALLKKFGELYLSGLPAGELSEQEDQDLLGHVQALFDFIKKARPQEETLVQVHNPAWCKHSVVNVLTSDQPFVIDTIWLILQKYGVHLHHSIHPAFATKRTTAGTLQDIADQIPVHKAAPKSVRETLIHIEFDRQTDAKKLKEIQTTIADGLNDAKLAVTHFPEIRAKLQYLMGHIEEAHNPTPVREENLAFLQWILADHFIFLGYRHYDISYRTKTPSMVATKGSGLGVLCDDKGSSVAKRTPLTDLAPNIQEYIRNPNFLTITKTLNKSRVHRGVPMDYIGIKELDKQGRTCAEHRFVGLFTSQAYTTQAKHIPIVGAKIREVLDMYAQHSTSSYNLRALTNILDMYPKDELFQTSVDDLFRIATGMLHLNERPRVRLFVRRSKQEQMLTAFVFLPLERMNSQLRLKIQDILLEAYQGRDLEFQVNMGDANLARLFFKIRTDAVCASGVNDDEVEAKIAAATLGWVDQLRHTLIEKHGEDIGLNLYKRYLPAFSTAYQELTPVAAAATDINMLENMAAETTFAAAICPQDDASHWRLRLFHPTSRLNLSDVMPMFDHLGLTITEEHPFDLALSDVRTIWLHDFGVALKEQQQLTSYTQEELINALHLIWQGDMESDALNGLIVTGGLSVRQVIILRALSAYQRQISTHFGKEYLHATLIKHPTIAKALVDLFDARLDPALGRKPGEDAQQRLNQKIITALDTVTSLDEDRILQQLRDIVCAILRTNAWQRGSVVEPLAIKINSAAITGMVKPTPWREIFVYHARMEGVHLRGGPVARGGLRWSDRHTDYRTEVLGLMKAQMTKNTIIIPVGAKGGFVLKQALNTLPRAEQQAAVERTYRMFIRGLLSVTDNLIQGKSVPPHNVRRYDEDDPYLVVAADKGTATFSDTANEEALLANNWNEKKPQGFWLGDAFASGGSNGYDHKKMGITARGAWESVKHHFSLLGKDIQTEDFTVVAIGDMAGDVFGNGMLLSKHICLVAAFNHKHIFIDPTPNAATSFKERQRLFNNVAGWDAYDTKKLSKGGRIYERTAKSLDLTPQIQQLIGSKQSKMSPNELMRHLLMAKVDLLWNGGIGTFIKAASESHADAADRANDAIRIDGNQVRAKVIGEGGNLGITQLGRIEFCLKQGGLVNTDALDNSAGVSASDHEVNIKILLKILQEKGKLTDKARNTLLSDMTENVADLVLVDNALQAQAITLKERTGAQGTDVNYRLQQYLTQTGRLDPAIEYLPDADTLQDRQRQDEGYTRPELAVLMAYAKADLYDELLASTLPDDPALRTMLIEYFPQTLQTKYAKLMPEHRLAREIVATVATNLLINRMGLTFVNRMRDETGYGGAQVTRAFLISAQIFEAQKWWETIESLSKSVASNTRFDLHNMVKKLVEYGAAWVLRHEAGCTIDDFMTRYQKGFEQICSKLEQALTPAQLRMQAQQVDAWAKAGMRTDLAQSFALLDTLMATPDVVQLSLQYKKDAAQVLKLHFSVGERLNIRQLRTYIQRIPEENNWQRVASQAVRDDLLSYQKRVTDRILRTNSTGKTAQQQLGTWLDKRSEAMHQYDELLKELADEPQITLAMMNVVLGQLKGLTG